MSSGSPTRLGAAAVSGVAQVEPICRDQTTPSSEAQVQSIPDTVITMRHRHDFCERLGFADLTRNFVKLDSNSWGIGNATETVNYVCRMIPSAIGWNRIAIYMIVADLPWIQTRTALVRNCLVDEEFRVVDGAIPCGMFAVLLVADRSPNGLCACLECAEVPRPFARFALGSAGGPVNTVAVVMLSKFGVIQHTCILIILHASSPCKKEIVT